MFVCFDDFFYGQKKIPREGHSVNDSKTTFVSTLASFVTEIFHECCPFRNTPLPLVFFLARLKLKTFEVSSDQAENQPFGLESGVGCVCWLNVSIM